MEPIILASQSPRRKELLALYGVPFEVDPSNADESHVTGTGAERVQKLAVLKAQEVALRHPGRIVLAADTLVCIGSSILGKPRNVEEAKQMLSLLSGNTHQVHTGVCLLLADSTSLCGTDTTAVTFLQLSDEEIERYVATGEPMDKAGAYAIQGMAGVFISHIEGSPSNVIGLPLGMLSRLFRKAGISFWPQFSENR